MKISKNKIIRMKQPERLEIARQHYGLDVPDDIRRKDLIKVILDAMDDQKAAGNMDHIKETILKDPASRQTGNKELFQKLTSEQGDQDPGEIDQTEKRGGARPGAGRKPGVTLEQSQIDNLPTTPNRSVEYGIKWLFRFWGRVSGCDVIALDDEELAEFALDTTQFLAHHNIKIPQGVHIDAKFIGGALETFGGRIGMHKMHKARMAAQAVESEVVV